MSTPFTPAVASHELDWLHDLPAPAVPVSRAEAETEGFLAEWEAQRSAREATTEALDAIEDHAAEVNAKVRTYDAAIVAAGQERAAGKVPGKLPAQPDVRKETEHSRVLVATAKALAASHRAAVVALDKATADRGFVIAAGLLVGYAEDAKGLHAAVDEALSRFHGLNSARGRIVRLRALAHAGKLGQANGQQMERLLTAYAAPIVGTATDQRALVDGSDALTKLRDAANVAEKLVPGMRSERPELEYLPTTDPVRMSYSRGVAQ